MTGNRALLGLGLAAAMSIAAAMLVLATGRQSASVEAEGPVLPVLAEAVADSPAAPARDLDRIVIRADDREHSVVRGPDEVWRVPDLAGYPADPAIVEGVVTGLAGLTRAAALTRRPDRFHLLGLAPPDAPQAAATRVTVTGPGSRPIADLLVGDPRPGGVGRLPAHYVRVPLDAAVPTAGPVPLEARAWLAAGSLELPAQPVDWVDRRLLRIDPQRLARLAIARPGEGSTLAIIPADGPPAEVARAAGHAVDDFMLVDPPADRVVTRGFRVDNLARTLEDLRLTDVRRAADFADRPVVARAVAETADGLIVTLETRHDDAGSVPWLLIDAQVADGVPSAVAAEAEAMAARTAGWAFRVPAPAADRLSATIGQVTDGR